MMKQLLFIGTLALFSVSIQAQSVKAKLGSGGKFLILDSGDPNVSLPDPDAEKIKLPKKLNLFMLKILEAILLKCKIWGN